MGSFETGKVEFERIKVEPTLHPYDLTVALPPHSPASRTRSALRALLGPGLLDASDILAYQ